MRDFGRYEWIAAHRWRLALAAFVLAAGLGIVMVVRPWTSDAAMRIDETDAALVARGRAVYASACASCHGASLEGQPNWRERRPDGRLPAPPHDASGHTWHHPDSILFRLTRDGLESVAPGYQSDMPAFADILSEPDILASLAYIKSTWPAEIRARQADVSRRAGAR